MNHNETVEMKLSELLSDRPSELCELAINVRREICNLAGSPSELIYNTHAVSNVFTYTNRQKEAFIHIAVYSEHLNLGFNYGAELHDPNALLEGSGKLIRHIRIDSASNMRNPAVRKLVSAAIQLGRQMAINFNGIETQKLYDKSG